MPEHLLEELDVGPAGDGERGRGVPQLVRLQVGDADGLDSHPELLAERAEPRRRTVKDAGEHQVVGPLVRDLLAELDDMELWDRDLAAPVVLGALPDHALTTQQRHRLGDNHSVSSQVEARNAKGGHLSEPHPGVSEEQHDEPVHLFGAGAVTAVLARVGRESTGRGEIVHLVVGEVAMLELGGAREVDSAGDIASQPPVVDSQVEDQTQHPVDLLRGGGGVLFASAVTQTWTSA